MNEKIFLSIVQISFLEILSIIEMIVGGVILSNSLKFDEWQNDIIILSLIFSFGAAFSNIVTLMAFLATYQRYSGELQGILKHYNIFIRATSLSNLISAFLLYLFVIGTLVSKWVDELTTLTFVMANATGIVGGLFLILNVYQTLSVYCYNPYRSIEN